MEAVVPDRTHRVLIVDDEITIRVALRRFFLRLGWSVEEAGDGESALDMLERREQRGEGEQFSLVVSDLRMPGLTGIELYDQLKLRHPTVVRRLVFSTGDLVSEEAAMFVSRAECPVLQKPFELALLRQVVDRVVAASRS